MAIDVHAHFWTDNYLDKVAALGKTDTATHRVTGAGDGADLDARLELMDHTGVQIQVLSSSPQQPYGLDAAVALDAARFVNDQYAALVTRYPERFRAFASLPLPHLDASLAELERTLDELGMVGVAMTTTILNQPLIDSPAAQLFVELDRRGSVLYLHPSGNAACSPLIAEHHGTGSIGAPIEDTISALHLITGGIPSRYPGMKVLNSHLGGALPMVLQRLDDRLPWEAPETPESPSVAARRMWYDTVSHGHAPALRAAVDTLGADRLLLGSDFPYENGPIFERAINHVSISGLEPQEIDCIMRTNAEELFGLNTNHAEPDPPPLAELTVPERIVDLAGATTVRDGSTLASTEGVELFEVTPLTVRAKVHDHGGDFDVTLASSQSGLKTWCSCGVEGAVCHHAAATALTAWQHLKHGGHRQTSDDR